MAAPTTPRRRSSAPRSSSAPAQPAVIDNETGAEVDDGLVEFTVTFDRDGVDEKHTFLAKPKFGYKQMRGAAKGRKAGGVEAILLFEQFIRPSLLNSDGTPAGWRPEVKGGEFVDPDGETRPASDAGALLEFEAGSSRRRWMALMDDDDDLQVDLDQIASAYETLVEASAERPTQRR